LVLEQILRVSYNRTDQKSP